MQLFAKIALMAALALPSVAHARSDAPDYEALTDKVRKSVYMHQYKRGLSLNSPATHSLLTQSFINQVIRESLTDLEPHLLYACAMPDLYDEKSVDFVLDNKMSVNRFALFQAARKYDAKKRFPTHDGMKPKKLYKIDDKKMKYHRKHWDENKYLPQTAAPERGVANPWSSDVALVSTMRDKCDAALNAAVAPHQAAISGFVENTINSKVEAAVK